MNTRLFPKGLGANRYRISGVAALCDIVILSDYKAPKSTVLKNCEITNTVTTVFVSMRNFEKALLALDKEVLSVLSSPFIVIIASEDVTFPKQLDKRFKAYSQEAQQIINSLFLNPHLQHCYVENLSHYVSPKLSPIPLGVVDPEQQDICADSIEKAWPLDERKLKVFCCHRIRPGEQWQPRVVVNELARNNWSSFCTLVTDEIPLEDYYDKVREHAFTLCVEGGGHDPSPKAFQVILKGGVPIIKSSALNPAYSLLNCVIVDSWDEEAITEGKLKSWYVNELKNRTNPDYLKKLHYMLTIDFWWGKISQAQSIASLGSRRENRDVLKTSVSLRKVEQVRGRKFETALTPSVWKEIQSGTLRGKYKGLTIQKSPFDRVLYQELLQRLKPASIIEVGSFQGGSALWLFDLCRTFSISSKLLSIDINPPQIEHDVVKFVYGDAFSPRATFPHKTIEYLPHPWLVISDSAHVYETESAVLEYFSDLMVEGDYIVVEDGVVSDFGLEKYNRFEDGPNRAVADFLAMRKDFQIDEKLCDFFGHNLTYCPNGWLYKSS